jgi:hypothetical protein
MSEVSSRMAEIRQGLPGGFCMTTLQNGTVLKITGPKGFKIEYYPEDERVWYREQWRSMRAQTVVRLMKEVAGI